MHFLDTNIVLRLFNAAAPEHDSVRTAIGLLESNGEEFRIGLQVLVEAWVVATRPVERNGLGWSAEIAMAALEAARTRFPVLVDDETTTGRWVDAVSKHVVLGKRAHDARIVALMASHGITQLLTLNVQDFAGMPWVVPVHPDTVVK
jgi:predicted nucleic acid-binding protein